MRVRMYARNIPCLGRRISKHENLGNFLCGQNPHLRANNVKYLRGKCNQHWFVFAFLTYQNECSILGKVHFIANFSLFAPISPHIQIGEQEMKNISYIEKNKCDRGRGEWETDSNR